MVGATDLQKAQMQIKWLKRDIQKVCSKAWWNSDALKEIGDGSNVPKYFIDKYGVTPEAINEAYFLGRQDGRLTIAKQVLNVIGEPFEQKDSE